MANKSKSASQGHRSSGHSHQEVVPDAEWISGSVVSDPLDRIKGWDSEMDFTWQVSPRIGGSPGLAGVLGQQTSTFVSEPRDPPTGQNEIMAQSSSPATQFSAPGLEKYAVQHRSSQKEAEDSEKGQQGKGSGPDDSLNPKYPVDTPDKIDRDYRSVAPQMDYSPYMPLLEENDENFFMELYDEYSQVLPLHNEPYWPRSLDEYNLDPLFRSADGLNISSVSPTREYNATLPAIDLFANVPFNPLHSSVLVKTSRALYPRAATGEQKGPVNVEGFDPGKTHIEHYPSNRNPLPDGVTWEQACKEYPNHLWSEVLLQFDAAGWSAQRIWDACPVDGRNEKENDKRPWNYLQQRLRRAKVERGWQVPGPPNPNKGRKAGSLKAETLTEPRTDNDLPRTAMALAISPIEGQQPSHDRLSYASNSTNRDILTTPRLWSQSNSGIHEALARPGGQHSHPSFSSSAPESSRGMKHAMQMQAMHGSKLPNSVGSTQDFGWRRLTTQPLATGTVSPSAFQEERHARIRAQIDNEVAAQHKLIKNIIRIQICPAYLSEVECLKQSRGVWTARFNDWQKNTERIWNMRNAMRPLAGVDRVHKLRKACGEHTAPHLNIRYDQQRNVAFNVNSCCWRSFLQDLKSWTQRWRKQYDDMLTELGLHPPVGNMTSVPTCPGIEIRQGPQLDQRTAELRQPPLPTVYGSSQAQPLAGGSLDSDGQNIATASGSCDLGPSITSEDRRDLEKDMAAQTFESVNNIITSTCHVDSPNFANSNMMLWDQLAAIAHDADEPVEKLLARYDATDGNTDKLPQGLGAVNHGRKKQASERTKRQKKNSKGQIDTSEEALGVDGRK